MASLAEVVMMQMLQQSRTSGFTLVELLVVLAIMGMIVMLAAPVVGRQPSALTRARLVRNVIATADQTRMSAITSGEPRSMAISSIDEALRWSPGPAFAGTPATGPTFYPDGTATGGAIFKDTRVIADLDWLSGRAAPHG